MKKNIFLCFVFASALMLNAQNNTSYLAKVYLNESVVIDTIEIKFEKLFSDSRCPKDAHCIWAGEAKVKVLITENGIQLNSKELTISATNLAKEESLLIYKSESLMILCENLLPYPEIKESMEKRDYCLEVRIF